jgi:Raf kinase inhibitor-like YbhB/YbcL family protein
MGSKSRFLLFAALALVWALLATTSSPGNGAKLSQKEGSKTFVSLSRTMTIRLTSSAFSKGAPIPAKHTCDGQDISPPLKWSNIPPGTKSFALVCDDPDAPVGIWVHWVLYGLPGSATELKEGLPAVETLVNGAKQGLNDFRRVGYGGPCPPGGSPHRYFFKLYALNAELDLPPKATKKNLLRAMEGHILAEGHLMGTYQRR